MGLQVRTGYRWWGLCNALRSDERGRQLEGTVEADALCHTAAHQGQAKTGGKQSRDHQRRRRCKKREPGRGHDDQDRPALIDWVSRQGGVVIPATRDLTLKTVPTTADLALPAGRRLSTDSASSDRCITGDEHDSVRPTKEDVRGEVHGNRAACLLSLRKPSLRVF